MQGSKRIYNKIKSVIKRNYIIRIIIIYIKNTFHEVKKYGLYNSLHGGYLYENKGCCRFVKDIKGAGNIIVIEENTFVKKSVIRIRGNNNKLVFHKGVIIGEGCSFWMEGNNCKIEIGERTTVTRDNQFNCQEDNSNIIIGADCMFSNNIIVRTSDSHPIYDVLTNKRLNEAISVTIGNHVWIAPNTKIMKGANIGNGSIIGSDTTISKDIPENSLAVGRPCRIVRSEIKWTREKLW